MSKFKNESMKVYLTVKVIEKPEFVGKTAEGDNLHRVVVQYRGQRSRKSKINLVYSSGLGVDFVLNDFYNINADVRTRLQRDANEKKYSDIYICLIDAQKLETEPDAEDWYNRVKFENLMLVCTPYMRKAYNDDTADVCMMTLKRRKTNSVNYFYPTQGWYDIAKEMGSHSNRDILSGYGNLQGRYVETSGAYKTEINISKFV